MQKQGHRSVVAPERLRKQAMPDPLPIVEIVGHDAFHWLLNEFNPASTLRDVPQEILDRIASVDITIRDYAKDRNAITSIALITFAYKMANMAQHAQHGAKDLLMLKVFAKQEKLRRAGKTDAQHEMWDSPVYALITGAVGDRIRSMRTMNSPI
jgi:hypothetical protein